MILILNATDFKYDGQTLSSFGFIICSFDDDNLNVTSLGSNITFNTVSYSGGTKYKITDTKYEECLQTTFDICKNPCNSELLELTKEDIRTLMRWLNRKEFLEFKLINKEIGGLETIYMASFNVEKLEYGGKVYGLRLTMNTDKPFGYGELQIYNLNFYRGTEKFKVCDMSNEEFEIYLNMEITCRASGDLRITNSFHDQVMIFLNCKEGEIINIDGANHIVTTSEKNHSIYNDFNFNFMKIGNSYWNRTNEFSVTLPCNIKFSYYPIMKEAL